MSNSEGIKDLRNEINDLFNTIAYGKNANVIIKLYNKLSKNYLFVIIEFIVALAIYFSISIAYPIFYYFLLAMPIIPISIAITLFVIPFNIALGVIAKKSLFKKLDDANFFEHTKTLIEKEMATFYNNSGITCNTITIPTKNEIYALVTIDINSILYGPRGEQLNCTFDDINIKLKCVQEYHGFTGRILSITFEGSYEFLSTLKIDLMNDEKEYFYKGNSKIDMIPIIEEILGLLKDFQEFSKRKTVHASISNTGKDKGVNILIEDYFSLDNEIYRNLREIIKNVKIKIDFIEQELKVLNE